MFSIITPHLNQLEWLTRSVASVADQACSPDSQTPVPHENPVHLEIEHIIQDGGTPGIEEFAREAGERLKSQYGGVWVTELQPCELLHFRTATGYTLRVFKEPDTGMYDALNRGIAKMSGDLWGWINSDEQYLPGTLAYVAGWFEIHPEADILCGDALLLDEEQRPLSYRRTVAPRPFHTRLLHLANASCASFYRRSVIGRAGMFDTRWKSIGDAEWMARLLAQGVRVKACRRLLASYAFTGRNTSASALAHEEGKRWMEMPDAPPGWMRMPLMLAHRLRKLAAGSYSRRTLSYALHEKGSAGRVARRAEGLGWVWREHGSADWKTGTTDSMNPRTIPILGIPLVATTYDDLSQRIIGHVRTGGSSPLGVDFANTQIVTMRQHDPSFAALSACIDVTVPDGMPLVWAMNRRGAGLGDRVYGPTFTRTFLASCPAGMTHYLIGGSEECGRKFRERMTALNPSLRFVGGYHGRCTAAGVLEDDAAVLAEIREKRPDFIWVGLGTPKQYAWIGRVKPLLDHGVMLAVGFAFDVNAGTKPDAPMWMQRLGLTWLYRMASEPRRLAGRYLKWNTLFLFYLAAESLRSGDRKTGKT